MFAKKLSEKKQDNPNEFALEEYNYEENTAKKLLLDILDPGKSYILLNLVPNLLVGIVDKKLVFKSFQIEILGRESYIVKDSSITLTTMLTGNINISFFDTGKETIVMITPTASCLVGKELTDTIQIKSICA